MSPGRMRRALAATLLLTALSLACRGSGPGARDAKPVRFAPFERSAGLAAAPVALLHGDFDGQPPFLELLAVYTDPPRAVLHPRDFQTTGGFAETLAEPIDLQPMVPEGEPLHIRQAQAIDLGGDQAMDLVLLNAATGQLLFCRNGGDGRSFAPVATAGPVSAPDSPGRPVGFAFGNFDTDGRPDIAVAMPDAVHFLFHLPEPQRWRVDPRPIAAGPGIGHILAGDLRRLGVDEIAIHGAVGLRLIVRNENRVFVPDPEHSLDIPDAVALALADLNGDGFLDLAAARPERGAVGLWLMDVDREWVPNAPAELPLPGAVSVTVSDVTADGRPDVLAAGRESPGAPLHVWTAVQRPSS